MGIFERIERRIILFDDNETRRSQKRLAIIVMFVATFFTAMSGVRVYNAGLTEIGWIYFVQAFAIGVMFVLLIAFPGKYAPIVFFLLCTSYLSNLPAHLLGGGYTSGLELLIWILLPTVIAVLFIDRRSVLLVALIFSLTVVIAGLLEPWARNHMPAINPRFATFHASSNFLLLGVLLVGAGLYLFNRIERYRQQADSLLLNVLPKPIADRLKKTPGTIADGYSDVTVLFADIVGFTEMSAQAEPTDVVNILNEIFSSFDDLAAKYELEKIKTIGDAYMVAGGLPEPRANHCAAVAAFAVDMIATMAQHTSWTGESLRIRVGINTGPVVAGVIGRQKFIYDLWGDAVNVASRMESSGLPNEIQVTQVVKDRLEGQYVFEARGLIDVKGKGMMQTYFLRSQA